MERDPLLLGCGYQAHKLGCVSGVMVGRVSGLLISAILVSCSTYLPSQFQFGASRAEIEQAQNLVVEFVKVCEADDYASRVELYRPVPPEDRRAFVHIGKELCDNLTTVDLDGDIQLGSYELFEEGRHMEMLVEFRGENSENLTLWKFRRVGPGGPWWIEWIIPPSELKELMKQ